MKATITSLFIIIYTISIFSQENCELDKNILNNISVVDTDDLKCIAEKSGNANTIIYTFGIWCTPCKLHLKNAIALKNKYDVNLLILLIESESNKIIQKSINYLQNVDSQLKIILLKDKYGKKRSKKYRNFLKNITPKKFENLNGMSKYLIFDKKGKIIMVTTWKDNKNYDWRDDSNMIKNIVIPLLKNK